MKIEHPEFTRKLLPYRRSGSCSRSAENRTTGARTERGRPDSEALLTTRSSALLPPNRSHVKNPEAETFLVGWLLWVRGTKGPEPQKCVDLPRDMTGRPRDVLAKHALTAELYREPLRVLATLFPAPAPKIEAAP
jgi:hypothetical protein